MVRRKKRNRGRILFAALLTAFVTVGIVAAVNLISAQSSYAQAQDEYAVLRLYASAASPSPTPQESEDGVMIIGNDDDEPNTEDEDEDDSPLLITNSQLDNINPDYIGWIRIYGTSIDYPVVRGEDNDKYLITTFSGEKNVSGTIFMDYRCTADFESPLSILHGHNMKDGSMFAELNKYPTSGFKDEHPAITIITAGGETLTYSVFAVITTDVYDEAYTLHSGDMEAINDYMKTCSAPEDAERYIALSTCTDGDDNERLLVFGALLNKA